MTEPQSQAVLKLLCEAYAITEEGDLIFGESLSMNDEILRLIAVLDYRKARRLRPLPFVSEAGDGGGLDA
jgi:hypothetical protein